MLSDDEDEYYTDDSLDERMRCFRVTYGQDDDEEEDDEKDDEEVPTRLPPPNDEYAAAETLARLGGGSSLDRRWHEEKLAYDRALLELRMRNARVFYKLKHAKDYFLLCFSRQGPNPALGLFSTQKPQKKKGQEDIIKYTRVYFVTTFNRLWQWCHAIDDCVLLEECLISENPSYLHMDIEVKVASLESPPDIASVLEEFLKLIGEEYTKERREQIGQLYVQHSTALFTQEECQEGIEHISDELRKFLCSHLAMPGKSWRFSILSGCRPSKFSFHLVCKDLLVDSNVCSMPHLVYEFGKALLVTALRILHEKDWAVANARERFLLRALMLESAAEVIEEYDENGDRHAAVGFRGYDDTPIDEGVYSPAHLLRAAGACKPGGTLLRPIDVRSGQMMQMLRSFSKVFPFDDVGYRTWCDHMVTCPGATGDNGPVMLWKMDQSPKCPFPRRALAQRLKYAPGPLDTMYDTVEYVGARFNEIRPSLRAARRLTRALLGEEERDQRDPSSLPTEHERISPDDRFVGEDGVEKPFRLFKPDEWICHNHKGGVEKTASAKVFSGGFVCFVCKTTFAVPKSSPWEREFEFESDEVVAESDPLAYMRGLPWERLMGKKFWVISAPMGSGKTEAMVKLAQSAGGLARSMVFLVHRRFLAQQAAERLGVTCYRDETADLRTGPRMLTLCVNSIPRLGLHTRYDIIVLDEAGLIRRHLFNVTIKQQLLPIVRRLRELVKAATHVILLQDRITQQDVRFFTELDDVDSDDRRHIGAFAFTKPVVIHPIRMFTNLHVALQTMLKCYEESIVDGQCRKPFMVFCNSVVLAEFLVSELRLIAESKTGRVERIQGVWAAVKGSSFSRAFSKDPNEIAPTVDVVVCTSVVGAGFSIHRHFHAFHAFLLTAILPFHDELQFIRRLRFNTEGLPEGACRQSYLFVQEGRGNAFDYERILVNLGAVRSAMRPNPEMPEEGMLAETHARIEAECSASRAQHTQLWKEYGGTLTSAFDATEVADDVIKQAEGRMKPRLLAWNKEKRKYMKHFLTASGNNDDEDAPTVAELDQGMSVFVCEEAKRIQEEREDCFGKYVDVVQSLAQKAFGKKEADNLLCKDSTRRKYVSKATGLVAWLKQAFDHEFGLAERLRKRAFDTTALTRMAHAILACELLPDLLGVSGQGSTFLRAPGPYPFYSGARYVLDNSLCASLKEKLEDNDNDGEEVGKRKRLLRLCALSLVKCHDRKQTALTALYESSDAAGRLLKKTIEKCGAMVGRVREGAGERQYQRNIYLAPFTIALALCLDNKLAKSREDMFSVLPLLHTPNLSDIDKTPIREGIDMFLTACESCAVDPSIPQDALEPPIGMRRFTVHPRRLADLEVERAHDVVVVVGGEEEEEEDEYNAADLAAYYAAVSTGEEQDEHCRMLEHERALGAAARREVPEENDWVPDREDERKRKRRRRVPTIYIDDEADGDDADDEDEEDEEEGVDSDSSSALSSASSPSVADAFPPKHRRSSSASSSSVDWFGRSSSSVSSYDSLDRRVEVLKKNKKSRTQIRTEMEALKHGNGVGASTSVPPIPVDKQSNGITAYAKHMLLSREETGAGDSDNLAGGRIVKMVNPGLEEPKTMGDLATFYDDMIKAIADACPGLVGFRGGVYVAEFARYCGSLSEADLPRGEVLASLVRDALVQFQRFRSMALSRPPKKRCNVFFLPEQPVQETDPCFDVLEWADAWDSIHSVETYGPRRHLQWRGALVQPTYAQMPRSYYFLQLLHLAKAPTVFGVDFYTYHD